MLRPHIRPLTAPRSMAFRLAGVPIAAAAALLLAMASSSPVRAESMAQTNDDPIARDEGTGSPPPGTLSAEGMVPAGGLPPATGPTSGDFGIAGAPLEPIGHVPGPGEGVYGDPPNSGSGNPETRGWAYDTDYFFALTHGLATDTDLGPRGRRWVQPLTFTFDVLTLPTAALAGLSGRAPARDEAARADASSITTTDEARADDGSSATDASGSSEPTPPASESAPTS